MVRRFLPLFSVVAGVTIFLDQVTKILIDQFHPQWKLGFFQILLTHNTGAGFGIFQGHPSLLAAISFGAAFLIVFFYDKLPQERSAQIFWALFLGGILGNFLDRLLRGQVLDFLDFSFWPSFNGADAAITVAVLGILKEQYLQKSQEKNLEKQA